MSMLLSERAGKWVMAAFIMAAFACSPVPYTATNDTGVGGGGSGEGGTGGEGKGGTGGGAGLAEGGTGGNAGDDEWTGPVGYVEITVDFPEVYRDFTFRVGKHELSPEALGREGCVGGGDYVVAVPEGQRDLVAKSSLGFQWRFEADVQNGACVQKELVADDSVSSFWAFGIEDEGIGLTKRMFPVIYSFEGVVRGEVSEFFVWDELIEKDPSRPKAAVLEEALRGRLFVFPVNEDDDFPRVVSFEGQTGSFIGSNYSGRAEIYEKGPDVSIDTSS